MFDEVRRWQGKAEELTEIIKQRIEQLELPVEYPTVRTVRLWRAKELFSQAKKQPFSFRQILEGLTTAILLKKGWTLTAIAQVLPSYPDDILERQILAESENQEHTWSIALQTTTLPLPIGLQSNVDLAEDAVILLAQGILVLWEKLLGNQTIIRQDDSLPIELYKAMCKLGRLYIEQGLPDEAACVHTVLDKARYPLNTEKWNLKIFRQANFRFSTVTLIDPDLRVPNADCSEIALSRGGFGEDQVIERRLFERLQQMARDLGNRRKNKAYTAIRMLFGKYSLIGERQLLEYLNQQDLISLQRKIIDEFFDPVPDIWLIDRKAYRCANCGTLLHPHHNHLGFICPIRQCQGSYSSKVREKLDSTQDNLFIAKPQILKYWTEPAIDELAIYETALTLGLDAQLYPESDQCDISINDRTIGIDAKSYTSPVTLALNLNRGIGGLIHYRRRIIAISDWRIQDYPDYIFSLQQILDKKGDPATLEIMSVSQVIQLLKGI